MSIASLARKQAAATVIRYGSPVAYTRTTPGTYDPATGSATTTIASYATHGLWGDYSIRQVDGVSVQAQDRRVMLPALLLEQAGLSGPPVPLTDRVDGMLVVRLEEDVKIGSDPIYYGVQVRATFGSD